MSTGYSEDGGASTTPTAMPAAAVTHSVQPDTGSLGLVQSDDDSERTVTDAPVTDDVSSVDSVDLEWNDMAAQLEHITRYSTSLVQQASDRSSEKILVPSSPQEYGADSDSREPSPLPPSSSLPPPPVNADVASLKVGQSIKLPERLISPEGEAAISLGPDGFIMSKIFQASATPADSARQEEIHVDGLEQEGERDGMSEFLSYSKCRKVSGVVKNRDFARGTVEASNERTDQVSAGQTAKPGIGDGKVDVRGEVRGVGVGRSGNRWWNWMGKEEFGSKGENEIRRREKRRFWGARDAQRREVPGPNAAENEDVVTGITYKAVIMSVERGFFYEVKMDGTRILAKADPSSLELVNKFRWLMRKRCDGYQLFPEQDGGMAVRREDGGLVCRIKSPDAF